MGRTWLVACGIAGLVGVLAGGASAQPSAGRGVDLTISTRAIRPVQTGIPARFAVTIRNRGPATARGVLLRVTLTSGGEWLDATTSRFRTCGTSSGHPDVAICRVDSLRAHQSAGVTFRVIPDGSRVRLRAHVVSVLKDRHPADNARSITANPRPPSRVADLGVAISGPAQATVGSEARYEVTITNHGPDEAHAAAGGALFLSDKEVGRVSVVSDQGTCSPAGICQFGSLATGTSASMTVVVTYSQPGRVDWIAATRGSDDAYDPGRYDIAPPGHPNNAELSTTVQPPPPALNLLGDGLRDAFDPGATRR